MSNDQKTELLYYEAKSFMGINSKCSVFLDLTKMKKNEGFIEMAGKQGTGKTSELSGIAYAMGAELGIEKKKLENSLDGKIDEAIGAKKGDKIYRVEVSSTRFSVKRQVSEGKFKVDEEDTPVNMMNDIFGPVGMFPDLQKLKGKEQILYFQETFGDKGTGSKKIAETEEKIDTVFNKRTRVNGEVDMFKKALEIEPLYNDYEKSQTRFAKPISADKEKSKYDELAKKKQAYDQYQNTLAASVGELQDIDDDIADLEAKLAAAKKKRVSLSESVEKGQKWVEDNKGIIAEFEKANKEWLNLSQLLADQEKWRDILRRERIFNEKTEEAITLTGELEDLRAELLNLTKKCLPKVPGLSIKVNTGLDKTKPHGVFYLVPGKSEEQPIHELSESEYADMWCLIWEVSGTKFIFIENITSFGTNVVDTLNRFVKNGGKVFYTKMDRSLKEKEITFLAKIA